MIDRRFAFFDTPIGLCAIVWSAGGIVRVCLPEASARETQERLLARCPGAVEAEPGTEAQRAVESIVASLHGQPETLSETRLDMSGVPMFERRVYDVVRSIRRGDTLTYGEICAQIGASDAARAVGRAVGRNPLPLIVPCHRVLAAGGRIGGFSAHGGIPLKRRLLAIESEARPLPLFAMRGPAPEP